MFDDVFTRKAVSEEDYEILGLTSSATLEEVTTRYHVLSKKNHPDAEDGSTFIFKQIVAAYERIRADRLGASHQPPLDPNRPTVAVHPVFRAWCVTRASRWRWAWVTAVVLVLLALIGTLTFTGGGNPSNDDAASVATNTPGTTPRSASIATRAIETPSPSSTSTSTSTVPAAAAVPSTTVPPPVACPTGTLTASGGVSVVTDSITSGQWEAVVSGHVSNDMSAPVLIVSTQVQLEGQGGSPIEPPMAAGGGGTTLDPGQSISIDDNQVQTVTSSGLPRVASTLVNWAWPANSPFESCPHDTLAVPNVG